MVLFEGLGRTYRSTWFSNSMKPWPCFTLLCNCHVICLLDASCRLFSQYLFVGIVQMIFDVDKHRLWIFGNKMKQRTSKRSNQRSIQSNPSTYAACRGLLHHSVEVFKVERQPWQPINYRFIWLNHVKPVDLIRRSCKTCKMLTVW